MDFTANAEKLGLDLDEYKELAELFVEAEATEIEELQTAIDDADWETAAGIAHSIKGAAGNMNFMEIYQLALSIEERIKSGNGNTTAELADQIQIQIQLINSNL